MNLLFIVLLGLACLLLLGQVANLVSMNTSDALGRSLSNALGVLLGIALWGLLAALYALARTKGAFPCFSGSAVLVLLPASFATLMATLSLFKSTPSARWLIVPAVAAPTILLLFAVALWFPALRPSVGSFGVNCAIWGSVLLLSALPWLRLLRQAQMDAARQEMLKLQQAARDQIRRERFAQLTSNSPLADWLEFSAWGSDVRDEALAGIRQLPRRQSDAEAMLANGEGIILEMLPLLDLQSTPALCLHARRFLCNYIQTLAGPEENSSSLPLAVHRLERFDRALEWLCRRHGDISPVFDCIEGFARKHPDTPERTTFLAQLEKRRNCVSED